MTAVSTGAAVAWADVYGLLLDDIRRNRAARLAAQAQAGGVEDRTGDDATRADKVQLAAEPGSMLTGASRDDVYRVHHDEEEGENKNQDHRRTQ
jgi:hypothetical protein